MTLRSIALFVVAALLEIGGAWLVWQAVREGRAWWFAALGVLALGLYGFAAAFQPDAQFGRILAAYGGIFVAGSLAWGVVLDGYRPDRFDVLGALVCLAGVGLIMYAPRGGSWPGPAAAAWMLNWAAIPFDLANYPGSGQAAPSSSTALPHEHLVSHCRQFALDLQGGPSSW